jgi:3-deoxy-7-phosphoheptulonate synthase
LYDIPVEIMLLRVEQLPTPKQMKEKYPLTAKHDTFIHESRDTIRKILNGHDNRLLMIVGPCSIHDPKAALQYARKLKKLATEVSDTIYLIMRVYFEKPRTTLGWKGILHDPSLIGNSSLAQGIEVVRRLLWEITGLGVPTASELLDPATPIYLSDLISWGCIGARTTTSQTHRQMASSLHIPIGFKNSTDGNIANAVNAVIAASVGHSLIGHDDNGQLIARHTSGNPDGHIVLRGGEECPNYDADAIAHALNLLKKAKLPLRLLVDCSHDNSKRIHHNQKKVLESLIEQRQAGNTAIRGIALESFLNDGNQELTLPLEYGVSITDACLSWEDTEDLIRQTHKTLNKASLTEIPSLCIVK